MFFCSCAIDDFTLILGVRRFQTVRVRFVEKDELTGITYVTDSNSTKLERKFASSNFSLTVSTKKHQGDTRTNISRRGTFPHALS